MGVRLNGSTSGYVELNAPAAAGTTSLELPTDSIKPGLVLVAQESFSAVSSVSVDDCFTATYDNYLLLCSYSIAAAGGLYLRMRSSGSDASGGDYYWMRLSAYATTVAASGSSGNTYMEIGQYASGDNAAHVTIYGPQASSKTRINASANSYENTGRYWIGDQGFHNVAASYDGVTIYPQTGTMTGSLSIYGYRKAL